MTPGRRRPADRPDPHEFTLRGIDPELWTQVRDRADSEDRDISAVLRSFLRVYARHGYTVIETFNGGRGKP